MSVIPTIMNRYTAICMSVTPTILNRYTAIKTTPSRRKRFFVCPKFPDSLRAQLAAFQWVMRDPSPGIRGGGVMMTHLDAVLRLRMCGAIPQFPQLVFMV